MSCFELCPTCFPNLPPVLPCLLNLSQPTWKAARGEAPVWDWNRKFILRGGGAMARGLWPAGCHGNQNYDDTGVSASNYLQIWNKIWGAYIDTTGANRFRILILWRSIIAANSSFLRRHRRHCFRAQSQSQFRADFRSIAVRSKQRYAPLFIFSALHLSSLLQKPPTVCSYNKVNLRDYVRLEV